LLLRTHHFRRGGLECDAREFLHCRRFIPTDIIAHQLAAASDL